MNALNLQYEDCPFSGVFSCGSIEHFGTLENVAKAASEMGRVLKPGGIMTPSTEFRVAGPDDHSLGVPGAILFTPDMITSQIVEASGLAPVDPIDFTVDADVTAEVYTLLEALQKGVRSRSICVEHLGFSWTPIALRPRKPRQDTVDECAQSSSSAGR